MKKLLQALNPEQREAVETTEGPLLVLAGAGTGKTRVITYRIAHLLQKGVPPRSILALTFTNKAAGEMRERVADLVGKKRAEELWVGTFHAFCLAGLRTHQEALGWPQGFTLADTSDQLSTLKSALRELRVSEARIRPYELLSRISLAKNRLMSPESWLDQPGDDVHELVGRAWIKYRELLARSRRMDFDDLLLECVGMLDKHPSILKESRERFRYLLVDEYQDTNLPQYEILRKLAGKPRNLCVVGDDDQSIYGWRGADVQKILSFAKHFPGAKTVTLETNYRSTEAILGIANRLIANNPKRHDKTLRSALGPGDPPTAVCMRDEEIEAEQIVGQIEERVEHGSHYDDFAILFRTATQARPFEAELRLKEIPYDLVGGMSFFDRKEVRDILSYLKLCANPRDETALLRVINCPPRGVGKTTIDRALVFATEQGISISKAFERSDEIEKINQNAVAAVLRLLERLRALRKLFPKGDQLVELLERLLEEVAYRGEVARIYPDKAEADRRWEGALDVLNYAENYVRRRKRPGLNGFLNELALTQGDRHKDKKKDGVERKLRVTLMSLHASKGLEYPHVYLVGCEEGLLPHLRSVAEDSIEEERRLTYVGVTRAQSYLTISWCAQRARAGRRVQCHPSRFLLEIQGKEPPSDWVPAGEDGADARRGRRKKRQVKKRRRRARG